MNALLRFVRLVIFVVIAPVVAIVVTFMFIVPHNLDWWLSRERREEAVDVWRKLWKWVQGHPTDAQA